MKTRGLLLPALIAGALLLPAFPVRAQEGQEGKMTMSCEACSDLYGQAALLADLGRSLTEARTAASEAGAEGAVAKIDQALERVRAAEQQVAARAARHRAAAHPKEDAGQVVNTRCPMMGGKVVPGEVAENLTREFRGRKVGFCCGGCPQRWDRLSDEEKAARLAKVTEKN